jgi:hypothetical protein
MCGKNTHQEAFGIAASGLVGCLCWLPQVQNTDLMLNKYLINK